jgi:DNA/RNA endonuclease YhcR with UshA esterase domain
MSRVLKTLICFSALKAAFFAAAVCLAADAPSDASKTGASDAAPKIIKPEEAKDYEGQEVTVEFTVAAGRQLDNGDSSVCFLNSSTERNDPAAFTAFISGKGLGEFKKDPKTEKPADYFKSKKVRVTGKIVTYNKKYEIKIDDPAQIKIVEENADENGDKKP